MKFKPSQAIKNRQTGKLETQHFYMKTVSTKELLETLDKSNTQPKLKQKIRNELVRRKVAHG
tara:strand:+ start:541 stop:726 length:186 start_codon:yes stop_codon:yes gene_type:complete